jgi:hypothetical protein
MHEKEKKNESLTNKLNDAKKKVGSRQQYSANLEVPHGMGHFRYPVPKVWISETWPLVGTMFISSSLQWKWREGISIELNSIDIPTRPLAEPGELFCS